MAELNFSNAPEVTVIADERSNIRFSIDYTGAIDLTGTLTGGIYADADFTEPAIILNAAQLKKTGNMLDIDILPAANILNGGQTYYGMVRLTGGTNSYPVLKFFITVNRAIP